MTVQLTPVADRRSLKQFIFLPEQLHRDHPKWMPPIYMDEWKYYDPRKNRAFGYSDVTMVLAWKDGRLVGRVMGIVNRRHNDMMKEATARFACLESTDDPEVAHALLAHVESWARERGMTKIIGPFGFNDQDPEGFLVEGFEYEPTIVTYYNFPYLIPLLEAEGYAKDPAAPATPASASTIGPARPATVPDPAKMRAPLRRIAQTLSELIETSSTSPRRGP